MFTTKKQSINGRRLAFYAKLSKKLDCIGQQLVDIFCRFEQQAVTTERLIFKSKVYNLLRFAIDENAHVTDQKIVDSNENLISKEQNLNLYEKYLGESQTSWNELKFNLKRSSGQFFFLLTSFIISLLISTIWLSPAFRHQLYLIFLFLISSFTKLIGFNGLRIEKEFSTGFCSLPLINGLQSAFLPPFDCNNCANLTKIDKLSNLDHHRFRNR